MTAKEKLISVITIVYNDADSVVKTIESVLHNKKEYVEYVVIDGGSSDGTVELIKQFASDIDIFISEKDSGISDAFNKGIRKSTGEWLLFLNSGDVFVDTLDINAIKNTLQQHNDKLVCFYNVQVGGLDMILPSLHSIQLGKERLVRMAEIPHQGAFTNRALFKQYGEFNTMFRLRMDYELFARVRKMPNQFVHINEVLAVYEYGGMSNQLPNFPVFFTEGMLVKIKYDMKMTLKEMLRFFFYMLRAQFNIRKNKSL